MRSFVKAILALGVGAAALAGARSDAQSLDQPPRHPIPYTQFKHRLNPHPAAKPHTKAPAAKPADKASDKPAAPAATRSTAKPGTTSSPAGPTTTS